VKKPWDSAWKTECRQRIKGCAGVIALISKNTKNADGARWEIKCAVDEGVSILGVHIFQDDDYSRRNGRRKNATGTSPIGRSRVSKTAEPVEKPGGRLKAPG